MRAVASTLLVISSLFACGAFASEPSKSEIFENGKRLEAREILDLITYHEGFCRGLASSVFKNADAMEDVCSCYVAKTVEDYVRYRSGDVIQGRDDAFWKEMYRDTAPVVILNCSSDIDQKAFK
jgi:hypothetical protein